MLKNIEIYKKIKKLQIIHEHSQTSNFISYFEFQKDCRINYWKNENTKELKKYT